MVRAIFILVICTFLLAALTTPIIYATLLNLYPDLPWPFSRVYDRVAMLWVVILLIILRKSFKPHEAITYLSEGHWKERLKLICIGAAISVTASLLCIPFIAESSTSWHEMNLQFIYKLAIKIIPAALIISIIEETFFRGLVLSSLQRSFRNIVAVTFTSILYAAVHFIAPLKNFVPSSSSPIEGLRYVQAVLLRDITPDFVSAFFGLFLVGITLAITRIRSRSIYLCIGLHSGWVIVVKGLTPFLNISSVAQGVSNRYYLLTFPEVWLSVLLVLVILGIHSSLNKIAARKNSI